VISEPASASAASALKDDPFYRAITVDFQEDAERRLSILRDYFSLSISEGRELGVCTHLSDPASGVAVWIGPNEPELETAAAERKRIALRAILGPVGFGNYERIVTYMHQRAYELVGSDAWYLSIIAVDPALQGRGLGQQLLAPMLSEADRRGFECYLETFSRRNPAFYGRIGFHQSARIKEPTVGAEYAIMVRKPTGK